jgi:hypothetical protein
MVNVVDVNIAERYWASFSVLQLGIGHYGTMMCLHICLNTVAAFRPLHQRVPIGT